MKTKQCPLCKREVNELLYDMHIATDELKIKLIKQKFHTGRKRTAYASLVMRDSRKWRRLWREQKRLPHKKQGRMKKAGHMPRLFYRYFAMKSLL
jgi:hypothetical protein